MAPRVLTHWRLFVTPITYQGTLKLDKHDMTPPEAPIRLLCSWMALDKNFISPAACRTHQMVGCNSEVGKLAGVVRIVCEFAYFKDGLAQMLRNFEDLSG